MFTLALTLLISFVIIEGVIMMNLLITILGDGFDRVKSTEEATRLRNFAEYMLEIDAQVIGIVPAKLG